ncbi:hypothetical protein TNCV_2990851 [Trichonephila clavipes]|nr:hypothetical protein TNCV_2990851 [Trichonephila clavipes]
MQKVYVRFGIQSPQSLNEGSFSFGSLLLQVVTGQVLWFKTSKGSDARNVQRMMMRGALWSAAPQYAVQCRCGGQ